MASVRSTFRSTGVAIRLTLLSTVVLGVAYPLAVWGVGQAAFHDQANGSMVTDSSGKVVGSSLIGQSFDGKDADRWFQSRPSAAGEKGYDANASSGSNLGPSNPDLTKAVEERRAALAKADGVSAADVPADAVTASGSGLDPDISPEYALQQVSRVASARGLSADAVRKLVDDHTESRQLGFLGEPVVNVLELNLALAATR
ncbi:potassium-transporting ATPase subunit KdpC [Curtobacterium sp. Csp1]|uniref:Potassium-transporting ATPase KdpC subunit n=1 Tax=Curtobacterium citreum TaxID=2036 RepID=A0ABT2HH66_9MICO|nr:MULTISPECIES: potassium-transporting ATPase subunit KdpC [Curtobacterium]MCS6522487.1 potassium-transporting ATPase subunit KdpC [Curtobacterium citreum]QKS12951.1 potassium-transporting ATPase subunit KdpC [Curtobacterium sp. csp3]QKS19164.1 potassium-transporting ATPase subunit KdpC [Curtobacterium sp. Csp1]RDI01084.1 K+-transporting ATPase ATPase C chain [Curtobacterium sp. AG1037]TQJ26236.1 K+-transporting ATPase ATPase C chain [Curtobacterium citreum]